MADVITIGGVDRSANVHWDSLKIEQVAGEYTAVCSLKLDDLTSAISIGEKDAITVVDGADTLFAGEVADVDWELLSLGLDGRRIVLACQDYGILVEEAVIDTEEAYSAQADSTIIADLFSTYRPDIDATTYVSTLDASMDLTVENMTLRQALAEICKLTQGRWYVDESKNLHYFSAEGNVAAWYLSDTPDQVNSFPYQAIRRKSAGGTIVNQILVVGTDVSAWREDAASIAAYGERPAVVVDTSITDVSTAQTRGDAILARWSEPRVLYDVTTRKTGLRAGMDVRLVCGAWSVDQTLTVRRLTIRWNGDERFYDLELGDLEFSALEGGRTFSDRLTQVELDASDLGGAVYDDDAPSAPSFNAGNLSTGTVINNDGTELVYIVTTWGLISDADLSHYEVQLSTAADFSANLLTRHHPGDGPRIERWEGLIGNVTYYARVRAVDWALNASGWVSASIVSATDGSAPSQVTGLVVAGARSIIGLDWDDNSEADLAYYEIQRAPDVGGSPGTWATIASGRHSHYIDESFSEAQVQASTPFHFRVRAVDTSGNPGNWSASDSDNLDPFGSDSIAALAIIAGKIAANAVDTLELNAGAVTTIKLAAGAATVEKLDVVVGGYNLLTNSGFNDDDDGDDVPDEWTESTTITNHSNELDASTKVVGASCFHVEVTAGDTIGDDYWLSQEITLAEVPLAVGDEFVLSGYIKTDSLSDLRATVFVQWRNAVPTTIRQDYLTYVSSGQDWTRDTFTETVPTGAVTAFVFLHVELTADDGTGHVRFDAIKLERGDVPTSWTTGMIGNVTIDSNRVQVQDSNAKVWLGKRGSSLGMWGEDASGTLQVAWYASGANAGGVVAGAGNVVLDANGMTISGGKCWANVGGYGVLAATTPLDFKADQAYAVMTSPGGTVVGGIGGAFCATPYDLSEMFWRVNSQTGKDSRMYQLVYPASGQGGNWTVEVYDPGSTLNFTSFGIVNDGSNRYAFCNKDLWLTGSHIASVALGCFVYRDTAQSLNNGVWTTITYNTEVSDTDACWSAGAATQLYAKTAGYYMITAGCVVSAGTDLAMEILKNGSIYVANTQGGNDGSYGRTGVAAAMVYLGVGDYIQIQVKQNSGSSQNTIAGTATNYANWASIARIA